MSDCLECQTKKDLVSCDGENCLNWVCHTCLKEKGNWHKYTISHNESKIFYIFCSDCNEDSEIANKCKEMLSD